MSNKGFTLMEIMIAVAIMAGAVTSLLLAEGSAIRASARAEQLTEATLLVKKKMIELELDIEKDLARNKAPDEKEDAGKFDAPFDEYRWKQSIKKVEIPMAGGGGGDEKQNAMVAGFVKRYLEALSKSMREVKVIVYWGDSDAPEEEQMQTSLTTHIVTLK